MTPDESSSQTIDIPESSADFPAELDRLFDDLHTRFLDTFGFVPSGRAVSPAGRSSGYLRAARVDVRDLGPSFQVVAEVPGIPKEKIDVRITGTTVEIRGEHASAVEKSDGDFVYRERRSAGYYRALELPEPVVAEKATAKVENGLLELGLPKRNPSPPSDGVRVPVE